eukprot:TRINITY_DN8515_c0_g1_i1.p1 TRINITY_DN8515_c0_g1~~TRINITY_DN8515_c0_g1_i1.p1  ORF type:complete len:407 (-),score=43.84 TRINITY_DN8515_c0_g1_i1:52-1272(-)
MGLPKYLKNVLNTGEGSDFSIFVFDDKGEKIEKKVHRLVIRQSPYFAGMLDLKGKEAKDGSVTIDNITNDVFDYVLNYFYTDELPKMTMEQTIAVASAADYLQLEDMKTAAINTWKELFMDIQDNGKVVEAFRSFASTPLNLKPDVTWRAIADKFIIAIYDKNVEFDEADESNSFIEFFVDLCGEQFPYVTADIVANWVSAGSQTTQIQQDERKKLAAQLVERIYLRLFSLRALALLSKKNVFPVDYLMKIMQQIADDGDLPAHGEVNYNITIARNLVAEFEHETSYALFRFEGFSEIDSEESTPSYRFLFIPKGCAVSVTIKNPNGKDSKWLAAKRGVSKRSLSEFKYDDGTVQLMVTLSPLQNNAEEIDVFTYWWDLTGAENEDEYEDENEDEDENENEDEDED